MAEKVNKNKKVLLYKGKPLVRHENTIYYGSMSDPYVAMLQITENESFSDLQLPKRILVQILSTNADLRPKERIIKKTEKRNLYEAMRIASIWLERTLDKA